MRLPVFTGGIKAVKRSVTCVLPSNTRTRPILLFIRLQLFTSINVLCRLCRFEVCLFKSVPSKCNARQSVASTANS